jgi:hypothetical protein
MTDAGLAFLGLCVCCAAAGIILALMRIAAALELSRERILPLLSLYAAQRLREAVGLIEAGGE